jgi:hypothetical protein
MRKVLTSSLAFDLPNCTIAFFHLRDISLCDLDVIICQLQVEIVQAGLSTLDEFFSESFSDRQASRSFSTFVSLNEN